MSPALRTIMDLVDDLTQAATPEAKNIIRSTIAFEAAKLTGDNVVQVFDALRDPPPNALRVPSRQRAVKAPKTETLEQVVDDVAAKLGREVAP